MKKRSRGMDDNFFVWIAFVAFLAWTVYLGLTQQYGPMLVVGIIAGVGMSWIERERYGKHER